MLFTKVSHLSKAILLGGSVLSLVACGELRHEFAQMPTSYVQHSTTPLSSPYGTNEDRVEVKSLYHWHGIAEDVVNKLGMMARMQGKPIYLDSDKVNPRLESNFDFVLRDALSKSGYILASNKESAYYTLDFSLDHADVEEEKDTDLVHLSARLMLDEILVTDVTGHYRVPEIGEERPISFEWSTNHKPLTDDKINE